MNFAVAGCTTLSVSDITVTDKETYEQCLDHCLTSWNDEAEASRTEAPYMTFDFRSEECKCWIKTAFAQTCEATVFKNRFLGQETPTAAPSPPANADYMNAYHACTADATGGGATSPPPSPSPAHLPPYPPAAPVLSPGEVKQTVSATFTMDAQCTDDLTSKIRTETAKACQVAVENTNVTCTPSTRRRRLDDAVSVTVTMGTTADSVSDVQAAAETFFGTTSAGSDPSPATTAFGTTVSGASVSAGAVSSGDPHLGFAHGGEADFRGRHGVYYNFFSAPGFGVNVKTEESRFFLHGNKLTVDGTFITEVPHSPPSHPSARPVTPCGSRLGARGRAQPHAGSNQVGQRLLHRGEPKRLQHGLGVRPGQLRRRKLHARARQPQEDLRPADRQDHLFGCVVHRRELDADRPRQLRLRPYLRAPAPP